MIGGLVHLSLNKKLNNSIFYSITPVGANNAIPYYGYCAYIIFSTMTILAVDPIRRACYEIFMVSHFLYIPAIAFLIAHVDGAYYGFIPGLLLHMLDIISRLISAVQAKPVHSCSVKGDITELLTNVTTEKSCRRCSTLDFGQYYFINSPDVSLLEWHPFSVSGRSGNSVHRDTSSIGFHIKSMGNGSWTDKLLKCVEENPEGKIRIAIDGPYGGLSLDLGNYKSIMMITGGIGITPMLPILTFLKDNRVGKFGEIRNYRTLT